ncbi:hypothetical protein EMEDMD4_230059 [Sinorhizobium medicae]|uniref:Uncharacterized protein n=1 Tax=Sinorhizobium medicae TaxID=110321 RepID=A0A508WYK6_9HYPH|nr:hypothetical protein EMEDMD4_230059 [Sinorhizobium medicae]
MRWRCTASASVVTTTAPIVAVESMKNVRNIDLLILFISILLKTLTLKILFRIELKLTVVNLRNISRSPYRGLISGYQPWLNLS